MRHLRQQQPGSGQPLRTGYQHLLPEIRRRRHRRRLVGHRFALSAAAPGADRRRSSRPYSCSRRWSSAKLLQHPEYATALRLACGSAAVASLSSFTLVLLQSRLRVRAHVTAERGRRRPADFAGAAELRFRWLGVASLFAGDVLSRLWIVAANLGLLAAVLAAASGPGRGPPGSPLRYSPTGSRCPP